MCVCVRAQIQIGWAFWVQKVDSAIEHCLKPGTCINKINRIIHTNSIYCMALHCIALRCKHTHTSVLSNKIIKAVKNSLCHVLLIGIIKCNLLPHARTHTHTLHGHESNAPTFNHSMIAMGFTTAFFLRYLNKLSVACGLPILKSQPPPQPNFHVADALAFCVLFFCSFVALRNFRLHHSNNDDDDAFIAIATWSNK